MLFSCAAGQPSWGDEHLGHSVFFHYLMRGWEGDANPKGAVTLDDLIGYVRKQTKEYVRTKMDADQAPVFTGEGVGGWVLSDNGWSADAEAKGVAAVERLGGTVTRDEERPGKPVVEVHLGFSQATDADLKELAGLKRLQVLALPHTAVTDAGLKELAALPALRKLYLNDTGVTDAGMKELARLRSLQTLYLGGTAVSDAGLKQLAALKGLQSLKVHSTSVTAEGVKELKAALPALDIDN